MLSMKRIIVLFLLAAMVLSLLGCSYSAYKHTYTDIQEYARMWELSGFRHEYDGTSPLFPDDPAELEVLDFFCRHDEQLPLGEGIQLLLHIRYEDGEAFNAEVERIASLTYNCNNAFAESGLSAYAMRLGKKQSSEYALVDRDKQTVYYIYLQNLPLEEIELDRKLVPDNYSGYGDISHSADNS